MTEIEESVRLAKEHLAQIDAELWKLREAHRERVIRERALHEDRLRDIDERSFYEREPLEKTREALIKTLVDVESMKAPQRLIAGIPFECEPTLPDDVMEARHADGRIERFKIES